MTMNASTSIGLHRQVLLQSFADRWNAYRRKLRTCRGAFSEETVHDVRVATRRLLAVLDIARALVPHRRIQKVRRVLKQQLNDLDDLHDVQVMLVMTAETLETLPELQKLQAYLERRVERLLRSAAVRVDATRPSDLKRRMEKIRRSLEKEGRDASLTARLLRVVDTAYSATMTAYGQMDARVPSSIHRLRIAFRKVRYTVEIIYPLVPDYPEGLFTRMREYQSSMGAIRDTELLLAGMANCATEDASFDAGPVRRFYEDRHARLISSFMKGKGEVASFWRAAPDEPFPWEVIRAPASSRCTKERGHACERAADDGGRPTTSDGRFSRSSNSDPVLPL
jgi:CHAD domain-containing protein